jgi:hypothetical protein
MRSVLNYQTLGAPDQISINGCRNFHRISINEGSFSLNPQFGNCSQWLLTADQALQEKRGHLKEQVRFERYVDL